MAVNRARITSAAELNPLSSMTTLTFGSTAASSIAAAAPRE
jgi:hypothetical protein